MRAPRLPVAAKLAPLAMTGIAVIQLTLAHLTPLTPWKGGGFGMFSRSDSESNRFVHAIGTTRDGRRVRVELDFTRGSAVFPSPFGQRVRAWPREADLERIAGRVLSRRVVAKPGSDDVVQLARRGAGDAASVQLRSVTVGVFARVLDRGSWRLVVEPIGTPIVRERGR